MVQFLIMMMVVVDLSVKEQRTRELFFILLLFVYAFLKRMKIKEHPSATLEKKKERLVRA